MASMGSVGSEGVVILRCYFRNPITRAGGPVSETDKPRGARGSLFRASNNAARGGVLARSMLGAAAGASIRAPLSMPPHAEKHSAIAAIACAAGAPPRKRALDTHARVRCTTHRFARRAAAWCNGLHGRKLTFIPRAGDTPRDCLKRQLFA